MQEIEAWDDAALDMAFEDLLTRMDAYAESWWSSDAEPQRSRLSRAPRLRAELMRDLEFDATPISTVRVYRDENGWDGERAEWQTGALAELRPRAYVAEPNHPLAFVTMGLPGSGKTTVLRRCVTAFVRQGLGDRPQITCDPDELRVRFPEYADGLGSTIVQDELQRLCYDDPDDPLGSSGPSLIESVVRLPLGRSALVFDTVGHVVHTPELVARLHAGGWSVYALVAELPPAEAMRRAKRRALASGRVVEPLYIEQTAGRPRAALDACVARGGLVGYAVVDTGTLADPPPIIDTDPGQPFGSPGAPLAYW